MELKYQYRQLKKSKVKLYDAFNLIFAWLLRPKNVFISSNVETRLKGALITPHPLYFDILVNRLTWVSSDKSLLSITARGKMITGKNVRISGGCRVYVNGLLEVGDNTYINPNSIIIANSQVKIGSNCAISWKCQILDDDVHTVVYNGKEVEKMSAITIGSNVWLGTGVMVLKGVTIGDGSVVAAGSVVTKDIAPNTLVAGSPAVVKKQNINWKS